MLFTSENNIKNEEIKQYLPLSTAFSFDKLKNFISHAESKYIKPLLGYEEYTNLTEYYGMGGSGEDEQFDKLLEFTQRALINLAMWLGFDQLNVQMNDTGFHRIENENSKSLFHYQEQNIKESFKEFGFNGLEEILEYLEENKETFSDWASSDEYTLSKQYFINSAKEFTTCYAPIKGSRLVFLNLRSFMVDVEDTFMLPLLGAEIFDDLKTDILDGEISEGNVKLLDLVKKCVANYTVVEAIAEFGANYNDKGVYFENMKTGEGSNREQNALSTEDKYNLAAKAKARAEKYKAYIIDYFRNNLSVYANNTFIQESYGEFVSPYKFNNTGKKIIIM